MRDAVWSAWKDLPDEAQAVLTKAGVKPPPDKEEPESQDALLDLLKVHQDSLPAEVKAYVESVDKAAMPSDDEAARSTTWLPKAKAARAYQHSQRGPRGTLLRHEGAARGPGADAKAS